MKGPLLLLFRARVAAEEEVVEMEVVEGWGGRGLLGWGKGVP